jgi:hypothetical protein
MIAIFFGSFLGSIAALLFVLAIVNVGDRFNRWRNNRAERKSLSRLAARRSRR